MSVVMGGNGRCGGGVPEKVVRRARAVAQVALPTLSVLAARALTAGTYVAPVVRPSHRSSLEHLLERQLQIHHDRGDVIRLGTMRQ